MNEYGYNAVVYKMDEDSNNNTHPFICICGSKIANTNRSILIHNKSQKHQKHVLVHIPIVPFPLPIPTTIISKSDAFDECLNELIQKYELYAHKQRWNENIKNVMCELMN